MENLGRCPRKMRFCPFCPKKNGRKKGYLVDNEEDYAYGSWCRTLQCPECGGRWNICTTCNSIRSHLIQRRSITRHRRNFHGTTQKSHKNSRTAEDEDSNGRDLPTSKRSKLENQLENQSEDETGPANNTAPAPANNTAPSIEGLEEATVEEETDNCNVFDNGNDEEEGDNFNVFDDGNDGNICSETEGQGLEEEEEEEETGEEEEDALSVQGDPPDGAGDDQEDGKGTDENLLSQEELKEFQNKKTVSATAIKFDQEKTINFFKRELLKLGGGGEQLIAQAFYNKKKKKSSISGGGVPEEDLEICLQMSVLVHALTTRQNELFGNFLTLLFKRVNSIRQAYQKRCVQERVARWCANCQCIGCKKKEQPHASVMVPRLPPIPTTFNGIRSVILSGPKAVITNLPHPVVHHLGDHAYVLPSECIRIFLARGHVPMEFHNQHSKTFYHWPDETPRGIAVAQKLTRSSHQGSAARHVPLAYVEWKDDCESSKSNKTSKSGSLWIWTMTIFERKKGNDSVRATFPVAIGLKTDNHEEVERIVGEDMRKLSTVRSLGFIGGRANRPAEEVTFSAEMYLSLGDQPERRGANCLMGGGSRSHRRWRYACDQLKLLGVLPACECCLDAMKKADSDKAENAWVPEDCPNCTNWMIGSLDCPLLSYKAADNFPKECLLGGETTTATNCMVNPIELTYKALKRVVKMAHEKMVSGEWSPSTATVYLKENCINEAYCKRIIERGRDSRKYRELFDGRDKDWVAWEDIEEERDKNPAKFAMAPPYPSVWERGLYLCIFLWTHQCTFCFWGW
jgi:hypothetical protein